MEIQCIAPKFILHPNLRRFMAKAIAFYTPQYGLTYLSASTRASYCHSFTHKTSYKILSGITPENKDDYYCTDIHGETYPLYLHVKCGHCALCRSAKASEWSFRAICENTAHDTIPLFITLTYNNEHLPPNGVEKSHVQKFLKRLRINLTRDGYEHSLRYAACGEYGSKSKRPHYHMILWGFPQMSTMHQRLSYIEKSYRDTHGSIGFSYVTHCTEGAISYVMKYMRKSCNIPGQNPVFFLSSRRGGGLGIEFCMKNIDYISNPENIELEVLDPISGKYFKHAVPRYFKEKAFPPLSRMIPKTVRDAHILLLNATVDQYNLCLHYPDILPKFHLSRLAEIVFELFSYVQPAAISKIDYYKSYIEKHHYRVPDICHKYKVNATLIDTLSNFLSYITIPTPQTYDKMSAKLSIRSSNIKKRFENLQTKPVAERYYDLLNEVKRMREREII